MSKNRLSKNSILFICLLIVIAAVPRAIELLSHNYLFGYDQGVFFLAVKKIFVDLKPTLIGTEVGGQGGFFQGPGWYYLLAIPFFLTGGDPYGAMVMMFLLGIGTVVFSFVFAKKMFGGQTGLATALLIAISPIIIIQSRFIWPPFPISFFTVLLLYFLYLVLQRKEKYLLIFTFILGLMSHFETATAATLFVSILILFPFLFIKRIVKIKTVFLSFLTILATQLPILIFDVKHNFLNLKGIALLIFSKTSASGTFSQVLENRWGVFKENFVGTFPGGEFLWPVVLIILILGLIIYVKDPKRQFAQKTFLIYLAISPLLLFLIFLKYSSLMWSWWILELNVYYCFLLGVLLIYLWNKYQVVIKVVIAGISVVFFSIYLYQTVNFYKNDYNDFGGTHKIKGKLQVIDAIYKDASGKPFNVVIFEPPIYTFDYDYLFWWYGQKKYGFIPGKNQEGVFYLLIEPDPHQEWTYKGWLETVIKNRGKILKTETLPSGFIIQKRIVE